MPKQKPNKGKHIKYQLNFLFGANKLALEAGMSEEPRGRHKSVSSTWNCSVELNTFELHFEGEPSHSFPFYKKSTDSYKCCDTVQTVS